MSAPATTGSSAAARSSKRSAINAAAITKVVWVSSIPWGLVSAAIIGVALGFAFNWIVGLVLGLVAGAAIAAARTLMLRAAVVTGLKAVFGGVSATTQDQPRLINLVEGLCVSTGIVEPAVLILDDPGANVATFGPPGEAVLVVTTGLLAALGRVELEAVVAEALVRIQQRDAELAGVVATFVLGRVVRSGPGRGGSDPRARIERSAAAAGAAFDPNRHLLADLAAVSVTRFPPGLRTAIAKMVETGSAVASATWGSAHCWMCDPLPVTVESGDSKLAAAVRLHPDPRLRLDLLAEL